MCHERWRRDKPASFYIGLQTNNITNDNVVYVYDDCDENGGTTGGGTGEGDDDDWTYTNGGQIEGGIAPGQPWTWVEPNGTGPSGSPSGPKPICLTDIIHISDGTGGTDWSSTPVYSTSGGSSNGGGSGGGGDGPCTPFPWVGLGIQTGSGQYQALFNPCFEEVPPPLDNGNGEVSDPCSTNSQTLGANTTALFNNVNLAAAKAEMTANYENEKSFSFGTHKTTGVMTATTVQTGTGRRIGLGFHRPQY